MSISKYSLASVFLTLALGEIDLSSATGFIVENDGQKYLVTNWHVLSGRNPETGQPLDKNGCIPDTLHVNYLKTFKDSTLEWESTVEDILDPDSKPLWLEHPSYGRSVDVVVLKLSKAESYITYPYETKPGTLRLGVSVANYLSIIGFPFGAITNGLLAIWLKGAIASEPTMPYKGLPAFLIDARTRHGQSGSPVITYSSGGTFELQDGSTVIMTGEVMQLQGIYSGRINEESDIGIVWRKEVIDEIFQGTRRGNNDFKAPKLN
jgi:hypothetical protein